MTTYLIVSVVAGILFAVLDGFINGNPAARRLLAVYQPIARTSLNLVAGILIDLAYGFILAGLFLLLYASLPGESGWLKGVSFAAIVWIFRVVMSAAAEWLMYKIPVRTLLYRLVTGLAELLVLGILLGLFLRPGQ